MTTSRITLGVGLALAGAALGVVAGSVALGELSQRNTAEAVLIVEVDAGGVDASSQFADAQVLIAQITNGYTALIRTPLILDDAIDELGADGAGLTSDTVAGATSVASGRTSPVVSISVTLPEAELAGELANAIATSFADKLNDGALPEMPTQEGVIVASLLREAGPGAPVLDVPPAIVLIASGLVGAALGFAVWWLIDRAKGTLRRGERLDRFGLDELGPIPRRSTSPHPPESARLLRSLLAAQFPSARVVVLTSTTSRSADPLASIGVARAFTSSGSRTLLVDADFADRGLGEELGLTDRPGFAEFLKNPDMDPPLVAEAGVGDVMTAGTSEDGAVSYGALVKALSRLRRTYDAVVVHAPALLEEAGAASILDAPGVVVGLTVSPHVDSRADVQSAANLIRSFDTPLIGALVVQS